MISSAESDLYAHALAARVRALAAALQGRGPSPHHPLVPLLMQLTEDDLAQAAFVARQAAEARAAAEGEARAAAEAQLANQIYLGSPVRSPLFAHLGWRQPDGRPVVLARGGGQVLLATGGIGAGKSQALLAVIEAALQPRPGLTSEAVPPTAAVAFHTDLTGVSLPELCAAVHPNARAADADLLWRGLGVEPRGLQRVRLLVHAEELDATRARLRSELGEDPERCGLLVRPLGLRPAQLGLRAVEALIGAPPYGGPDYQQVLLARVRDLGEDLSVAALRACLRDAGLDARALALALTRLDVLARVEDPRADLWDDVEPGALTIFGLQGRWLRRRDVFPLLVALLNGLVQRSERHGAFQRLLALDEVNRLGGDPLLWEHLVMTARQARHLGLLLWLSGQDLLTVPDEMLALATHVLCFRLTSPLVFQDLRRRAAGLGGVSFGQVAELAPGHAIWVASESTEAPSRRLALPVYLRPATCAHGGHTRTVL